MNHSRGRIAVMRGLMSHLKHDQAGVSETPVRRELGVKVDGLGGRATCPF